MGEHLLYTPSLLGWEVKVYTSCLTVNTQGFIITYITWVMLFMQIASIGGA